MMEDLLQNLKDSRDVEEILQSWPRLNQEDRFEIFHSLRWVDREELFLHLGPADQAKILETKALRERRTWLRILAPDDVADLIQEFPPEERADLIALLDPVTRADVIALLTYKEDNAGGIMNPRFVRLRPETSVEVAIRYLRAQARSQMEHIHYAYVIDENNKLLGTVSFRELLLAAPEKRMSEIMETDLVTVPEHMDQEDVGRIFQNYGFSALPVVDNENRIKGIVTIDDVVDVVQEEATEDIHKIGGTEALGAPYLEVGLRGMVKKRAGWLVILFIGEMFTATAMRYFEHAIHRAVVLALFIPLIISSGGNSGSQASTLVIRAMALGEVKTRDWWRVFWREISSGLALGLILGAIGLLRILLWPTSQEILGEHYVLIGFTVALSLIGIVLWGTITGSMLPFLLRRLGFDPASASAPFVATIVDVTGIVIYFTVASLFLSGTLL